MADVLERLKAALADRYTIECELGSGGMATVYLAEDVKHHRKVAVKILRPELAAVLGAERFLKEIEVTAHLQHPHILPLFDSGEADGLLYYVMPLVEGDSLRKMLDREKQLSVDEALRITSQVANALSYAHAQHVVHRDIKPENILFQADEVVVADFGIALAVDSAGGTRLTETGFSLGTPAYMSPEQVSGEQEIDGRSDIYSLACVLYEMLAGDPPFVASTPRAVLAKHVTDPAPPITTVRPGVPSRVTHAIAKALGKAPSDRFDSAKAFVEGLRVEATQTESDVKSIVVLPFENLSPDPDQEYFSDGLTEEVISDLSRIRSLRVISRSSAMTLKGSHKRIPEIARELDVRYALEGSVRKAGSSLRITAQLIDAEEDAHLWSDKYAGTLEDVFDIQERVSRAIVDALKVALDPEEEQWRAARPVDDLVAFDCYLKARHQIWDFTEESMDNALALLDQGLAILPDSSILHATKAVANVQYLNAMNKPPATYPALLQEAQTWASRALELDQDSSEAHYAQGTVSWFSGNPPGAVAHWVRAAELNPNHADAHGWLGFAHYAAGYHLERAEVLVEQAARLDPLNPLYAEVIRACDAWYRGDFRTVLDRWKTWREMAETTPSVTLLRLYIGYFHAAIGDTDPASEWFDRILRDTPDHPAAAAGAFLGHALRGERGRALEAVTETLEQAAWWDDFTPVLMADGYALIGEQDPACRWVERAIEMGTTNVAFLGEYEPFLRSLRGNQRFAELLKKADAQSRLLTSQVDSEGWA